MNKEELKKLALEKSNVVSRILKSKEFELFSEINSLEGINFNEKLYKYIYGEPEGCKRCKSATRFRKFNSGYSLYCSQKCASLDTSEKRKESIKKTFNTKYNVDSPSQLPLVKSKIKQHRKEGRYDNVGKKAKITKKERYGDENYINILKIKEVKRERYGDENYNNRDKAKNTIESKYGDQFYIKLGKKLGDRARKGELGFKSEKYKEWLKHKGIKNVSELESVKQKKFLKRRQRTYGTIIERLKDYVEPLFEEKDLKTLGYYTDNFNFKCKICNNEFSDHLASAHIPRCPTCFPKRQVESRGEQELTQFIEKILGKNAVEVHNRTVLDGKELDIYIPSKNLAIEYNGIYWHGEIGGKKDKNYHLNKTKSCENKNIRLIHIFEDEWILKKEIVKQRIKHILNLETKRVYARQCTIRELDSKTSNKFLEKHHIQGSDKSSIRLGAFHKEKLVSIMTFSHLRVSVGGKVGTKDQYELIRFCNSNLNVVGIAGKLLKHFIKNYNPDTVITYADRRWSSSNSFYSKIGFKLVSEGTPNYWYTRKNSLNRFHRFGYRKGVLVKKLKNFDSNLTEWENMQINGFDRVWDCGSFKYELHR